MREKTHQRNSEHEHFSYNLSEGNSCLKKICSEANITFLDHSNIINPRKHLNNSRLHLNTKEPGKLRQNIINFVTKFCYKFCYPLK